MQRAVFLDRDGVINRCEVRDGKPYAPRRLADFRLLPGTAATVEAFKQAGLLVIVVTNQPDIGNGLVDAQVVEAMHERMRRRLAIDDILMCPHRQDAGCECRKPRAGLLLEAAKKWRIDLAKSFMVGDRWGDVVAGQAVGCYTVFVDRGYKETRSGVFNKSATSLRSAAQAILSLV